MPLIYMIRNFIAVRLFLLPYLMQLQWDLYISDEKIYRQNFRYRAYYYNFLLLYLVLIIRLGSHTTQVHYLLEYQQHLIEVAFLSLKRHADGFLSFYDESRCIEVQCLLIVAKGLFDVGYSLVDFILHHNILDVFQRVVVLFEFAQNL